MHSQYEELCALAITGQASAAESALLDEHLVECAECRSLVQQVDLRGSRLGPSLAELFRVDAEPPGGMRDRFLTRAAAEGLRMQAGKPASGAAPSVMGDRPRSSAFGSRARGWFERCCGWRMSPAFPIAGLCLVMGILAGCLLGERLVQGSGVETGKAPLPHTDPVAPARPTVPVQQSPAPDTGLREQLATLTERLRGATAKESTLEASNKQLQESLASVLREAASAAEASENELKLRNEQSAQVAGQMASLRQQLEETRAKVTVLDAVAVEQEKRTAEAEGRLAQAKLEMNQLYAGRGSAESMIASRNLHIIDVYDDTGTARQRAFGRVFYVEGKSLVFYAYDLPSPKRDKNFSFQLWGEGPGLTPTTYKLGLMRPDGNGHGQWVVACDDSKVLNQLRGVFIAPAAEGSGPPAPSKKLMYALLGTANHP